MDRFHGAWTGRRCGKEARRHLTGAWHAGARGCRCSLAVAGEDEEDEVEAVRGSLEHERGRRGDMTMTEDGSSSSSTREQKGVRESLGEGKLVR
jgi:hypothetical protein